MKAIYRKQFLPNYGVFDEDRYFQPGRDLVLLRSGTRSSGRPSARTSGSQGRPRPISHSPARTSSQHLGLALPRRQGRRARGDAGDRARDNSCWIALVNAVGGQDELVFDGQSSSSTRTARSSCAGLRSRRRCCWSTSTLPPRSPAGSATPGAGRSRGRAETCPRPRSSVGPLGDLRQGPASHGRGRPVGELEEMRLAIELGLRDYAAKNGFTDVVLGISGGIDSALTAALAAEALGPEHVVCVSMPSRYSSPETRHDARAMAESIGTRVTWRSRSAPSLTRSVQRWPEPSRERCRTRRGERPGAGARPHRHGPLQQVRLARAGHREQERAVGGLRDPLRRHGRRVRAPQGRVQDGRLPARAASERPRRPRADPRVDHRRGRRARSCARTSATRTRCRPTRSSTRSSRRTSSWTARGRS